MAYYCQRWSASCRSGGRKRDLGEIDANPAAICKIVAFLLIPLFSDLESAAIANTSTVLSLSRLLACEPWI